MKMEKSFVTGYCAGADGGTKKFHELDIPHSAFMQKEQELPFWRI